MSIQNWYEHVDAAHNGNRVIIALLPDEEGMRLCRDMNHELYDCWTDGSGIVFADHEDIPPTSVPHMSIAHIDCDVVPSLQENLDRFMVGWQRPIGIRKPPLEAYMKGVSRYVNAAKEPTPLVFWDADLSAMSLRGGVNGFASKLLVGNTLAGVQPVKAFATPGSLDKVKGLTNFQIVAQKDLGYSHAGLWHITLGLAEHSIPVRKVMEPHQNEVTLHFSRLALGYCGPHGTMAKVIQTWPLY